jgi:hypothetical protein
MLLWKRTSFKEDIVPIITTLSKTFVVTYNPLDKTYKEFEKDFQPFVDKAFAVREKGQTIAKLFFYSRYGVPVPYLTFNPAKLKEHFYPDKEEQEEVFTYDNGKPFSYEDTIIRLVGAIGSVMD